MTAAVHDRLAKVIAEAWAGLEDPQKADGHWVFELEANTTILAEYVLLEHFLSEIDQALENKIAVYLRTGQADHGGWPLYAGGDINLSLETLPRSAGRGRIKCTRMRCSCLRPRVPTSKRFPWPACHQSRKIYRNVLADIARRAPPHPENLPRKV
jgi:hypothetical protein